MRIRAATLDDCDAIFDLLTRRSRAAFGISEIVRGHVAQALALVGSDHFVAEEGAVVGYAALDSAHVIQVTAADDAVNDALLATALDCARARGFASVHAVVVPEDAPLQALVRRARFAHRGDVLRMWRSLDGDLDGPRLPDGVALRTYDDSDAPAVQRLLDTAYARWDPTYAPRPHDDWLQWMTKHDEFDPGLWFLVERDDDLVACALHWREHQRRGWVKDLVVRDDERGRGIAKALLFHGFAEYAARGVERVGLKVDATNPTGAVPLYERVGFVADRTYGTWVIDL